MPILDSIVCAYTLSEASGTRNDSVSTNHLTDNNTVAQGAGIVGNAAEFVLANSESLTCASNVDLQTGDVDWTFTCWVSLASLASNPGIASKSAEWGLYYSTGNLRFEGVFQDAAPTNYFTFFTGVTPSVDTWYFLSLRNNTATDEFVISVNDGTPQAQSYGAAVARTTSGDFRLGQDTFDVYMSGKLDAVEFWKRYLTDEEIVFLYNEGAGLEHPFDIILPAAVSVYLRPNHLRPGLFKPGMAR